MLYIPQQFSAHFHSDELTRTEVRSLQDLNRSESMRYISAGQRVAVDLLERVRALLGEPLIIDSGFRCEQLNGVIGGSPTSQHMIFEAADFNGHRWGDVQRRDALKSIMASAIPFHQLLIEHGCLHISLPHANDIKGEVAYWEAGTKKIIRKAVTV